MDLPGHGGSPGADWIHSNDDMADAVGDFLEAVLAGQRFALAGQSYGGYIARAVAHRFAERMLGLMLWVPAQYPRETRHPPPRTVLHEDPAATSCLSSEDEQQYGRLLVIQGSEGVTAIQELIVPATKHADQAFLGPVTGSKFSFDPEETPFPHPTLIVCGRQDMLVGYRDALELIERYPRATVAILDYAGHFLGMTEENQVFRMLVADWLRRMEAATTTNGA